MPTRLASTYRALGLGFVVTIAVGGAILIWDSPEIRLTLLEIGSSGWMVGGERVTVAQGAEAIAVFLVCFAIFAVLSPVVEHWIRRATRQQPFGEVLARILRVALLSLGTLTALSAAGIGIGMFAVFLSAAGVGAGLAVRHLASNYASGFVILLERAVRIGDIVRSGATEGRVTDIGYRAATVLVGGRRVLIPNDTLANNVVENVTLTDSLQLLTTQLSIDQAADVDFLRAALVAAMVRVPDVLPEPAPTLEFTGVTDGLIELTACYWVSQPARGAPAVRSEVNMEMLRVFRRNGIPIFPRRQTAVHVRPASR